MKNLALFFSIVLFSSCFAQEAQQTKGYQVGDYVEDFKLKNVDGSMVSLENLEEANGAIVIFSCNHCPYVVASEDRMIKLHKTYAPQGYPVVAINPMM